MEIKNNQTKLGWWHKRLITLHDVLLVLGAFFAISLIWVNLFGGLVLAAPETPQLKSSIRH